MLPPVEACAAKTDEELLAMVAAPDEWSAMMIAAAQQELTHRNVPFTAPPSPLLVTQPVGWPLWAFGTLVFSALGVWAISAGWGPRSVGIFVLPAAACLGMTIRRLMRR